jgi:hypothetical protein
MVKICPGDMTLVPDGYKIIWIVMQISEDAVSIKVVVQGPKGRLLDLDLDL